MIHDARTNPFGLHLPIEQWARHTGIRQLAAQRGIVIPPLRRVAGDATPARALLNHGTWKAFCPDCIGSAEDLWRGRDFFCMRCGNASIGGVWRPVAWPENLAEIEARLDPLPVPTQIWEPWGEARDPVADAEEWLAHARVTMDPEHGLTANEVGGADDPEIWTPPFLATTNAIIASSDCNAGYRGNLLWIRQFLSANPGGASLALIATGTDGAAWSLVGTLSLADLSVTTAKLAALAITNDKIAAATIVGADKLVDTSVTGGKMANATIDLNSKAIDGSLTNAKITDATIVGSTKLVDSSVTGAKLANATIDGSSKLIDGSVTSAKITDGTIATGDIADGAITTAKIADGTIGTADLADGIVTSAKIADATIATGDLADAAVTAAKLGAGAAKSASGTYTGNGGTSGRQITTGFVVKEFKIHDTALDVMYISISDVNSIRVATGNSVQGSAAVHTHASDGFVVGDGSAQGNVNTNIYHYTAFG